MHWKIKRAGKMLPVRPTLLHTPRPRRHVTARFSGYNWPHQWRPTHATFNSIVYFERI